MDIKLEKGDYKLDSKGLPVIIDGLDEIIQQAFICVAVPKGSFPYDRSMGGDRNFLDEYDDAAAGAMAMAENALAGKLKCGVKITDVVLGSGKAVYELETALGSGRFEINL